MKANNIEERQGVGEIGEGHIQISPLPGTTVTVQVGDEAPVKISCQENLEISLKGEHSEAQKSAEDRDTKVRKLRILSSALKFFGGIFSSIGAPTGIFVTALISACVIAGPVVVKIAIASFVIAILGILILAISVFLDNMVATITGKANILKNS